MRIHQRDNLTGDLILPSVPGAFSYWMMPEPESLSCWQPVVDQLAETYGGQKFEPHATVYFSSYQVGMDPKEALGSINPLQIELRVAALEFSEVFTKTCYIQFEPNEELASLSMNLQQRTNGALFALNPHMSLFYGRLTDQQRDEIKRYVEPKLPDTILFNAIWAVSNQEGGVGVTNSSHVAGWQLAAETNWPDFSFS